MEVNKRNEVQAEALNVAVSNKRTGLGISVGVGKTRIGINHMLHLINNDNDLFYKFLVVAPKISIFESWKKEIAELGYDHLLDIIVFSTYRSINKHNPSDFTGVYLDECHNLLESHTPFLSQYKGYILGLTGTPPRYLKSTKGKLVQVYCPIRYTYFTTDAVDDNILNDYSIVIHPLNLGTGRSVPVKNKKTGGVFYTSEVDNYNFWTNKIDNAMFGRGNPTMLRVLRMKAMKGYKTKLEYVKYLLPMIEDKCIIFANTIEQAEMLSSYSYHSKNPDNEVNLEKFSNGEIDVLSCVEQLSEGVNIPDLKSAIIMHAYGNEKKLMQRLGRLMRLKPDEKATIHILMYNDTQDVKWVDNSLQDLDSSKISYFELE